MDDGDIQRNRVAAKAFRLLCNQALWTKTSARGERTLVGSDLNDTDATELLEEVWKRLARFAADQCLSTDGIRFTMLPEAKLTVDDVLLQQYRKALKDTISKGLA